MRKMKIEKKGYAKLLVRPVVVVTTISGNGISNAAPFSFNSPISFDPPLYGFSCNPKHDTWKNIQENGEFVVNIAGADLGKSMEVLEKDFPYEVSEIEKAGMTEEKGKEVKPPRIKEAKAWIECKMENFMELGDHIWIVGRVLEVETREEFWNEVIDVEKAKLLCHIGGEFFAEDMKRVKYKRAKA